MKNINEKIKKGFDKLLKANAADFDSDRDLVVKAFVNAPAMFDQTDIEALNCFNPILVSFGPNLTDQEAHHVRCTAEVLYAITLQKCGTESNTKPHGIGWAALNRDAKGWCARMFLHAETPGNLSKNALVELWKAKCVAVKILHDAGLQHAKRPPTGWPARDPLHLVSPIDLLNSNTRSDE